MSNPSNIPIGNTKDSIVREEMKAPDYLVAFSGQAKSYCVGLVDIVTSTQIAARLNAGKMSRYYEIFMNSISQIIGRFGGSVIKNVGDGILYFFPESSKPHRKFGFLACLECDLAICEARNPICQRLQEEGLPCLDFRISSDYGNMLICNVISSIPDMIGPPLNMCAKINQLAPHNGVVIGGDLYESVKNFDDYYFKPMKGYSLGFKYSYPVYSVNRKK
ncbi:MAG: adenylate/guanylate cyclase domain-containing protein [Nitrosopumilaceae archaeon]